MLAFMSLSILGCSDPEEPVTGQIGGDDFKIELIDVTTTSVEFRVTPKDKAMTYVAMMTTKEYMDGFVSDEDYIRDDLVWFSGQAYDAGMELEEYLERELKRGVLVDSQGDLDPMTDYYIYAYGLSTQGTPLTAIHKLPFTTKSAEKIELNFDIEVSDIGYSTATISVVPESKQATYFVNVFSDEDYEYWGGDETAFERHLIYLRSYYLGLGASVEEIVANLGYVGNKSLSVNKLKAGEKYMAYAIGVNDDFIANSLATTTEFTTLTADSSDLSFEIALTKVDYDHIEGMVTPSNNEESYICTVQTADFISSYASDSDAMNAIIQDIDHWQQGGIENALRRGPISLDSIGGLVPETDYCLVCFGFSGAATTPLFKHPFTTPTAEGNPEELVVELSITDLTHNSVRIVSVPSVGAWYFVSYAETERFDRLVSELGSQDLAIAQIVDEDIDYGADYLGCSRAEYLLEMGACLGRCTTPIGGLTPLTEYVAFAMAVDLQSGELASSRGFTSERFTTIEKVYSDVEVDFVFGDYYDGTALAEIDPANFLKCKGLVVVPYTIEPKYEPSSWYSVYYEGDYSEWGCSDDDIYDILITYGYESNVEDVAVNRTNGVAVLKYDTPYSFLGIAKDSAGNYGHGELSVVSFTRQGVSPAEEFIETLAKAAKSGASIAPRRANEKFPMGYRR